MLATIMAVLKHTSANNTNWTLVVKGYYQTFLKHFCASLQLREATSRVEELETTNKHLETRLGKLKTAKSALLKDL